MLTSGFSMAGFYTAVLVNVPLAWLLLWLYRRAVVRAMRTPADDRVASAQGPVAPRHCEPDSDLTLHFIEAGRAYRSRTARATRDVRAAVAVTAVSGTLYVLIVTAGWQSTMGGVHYPSWTLWWVAILAWPVPLACGIVAGAVGTDWLKLAGVHVGVAIALSAINLALHQSLTVAAVSTNAATVFLVAVPVGVLAYRRIRAVGLLVLAFTLVLLVAAPSLFMLLLRGLTRLTSVDTPLRPVLAWWLVSFGEDGVGLRIAATAAMAGGLLGWWALRGIGWLYRRKRQSDQSLLIDALWWVVTISHVSLLSTQGGGSSEAWAWIVAPLTAFATYWLVQHVSLGLLARRKRARRTAPLLLLLRVFSLGRRSERLFDVLAARWRHTGAMAFIAGPDLATGTVQPSQFLEFVSGRLKGLFIRSPADVARRASELDLQVDADGLYRVNPLYCFADTWQDAVRALAGRADAVLMDLRGFSAANQGCAYELEHLLASVPLSRVLLVVDPTTDGPCLEATLRRLWQSVPHATTGAATGRDALRIVRLQRSSPHELRAIANLVEH